MHHFIRYKQRTKIDCMRCCVSSLLNIRYEDATDFNDSNWVEKLVKFANNQGFLVHSGKQPPIRQLNIGYIQDRYNLIKMHAHAVIMYANHIVYDPGINPMWSKHIGIVRCHIWFTKI